MSDDSVQYEKGVAERCAQACDQLADGLEDDIKKLHDLTFITGFGGFDTGKELEAGFRRKASLAIDHFRAHQQIARNMATNFRKIGASYDQTDDANSAAIRNADVGIPGAESSHE